MNTLEHLPQKGEKPVTMKQSNITTKKRKNPTSHASKKPNVKEAEKARTKTANSTKDQMRLRILHNMENIISNFTCTTNQSMSHHKSNNSNTCGTTITLDHQPLTIRCCKNEKK